MTQQQVLDLCKTYAPQYELDPVLVLAVCQQESSFFHDAARLEQGFYRRYTMPDTLATTTEILLASSYGLMQTMGQILREHGFFKFYREYHNKVHAEQIVDPLGEVPVVKGINAYMVRPPWQVEWGCIHLRKKMDTAKGDVRKALLFWNGGGNPSYPGEVLLKYGKLGGKGKY